MEAKNYRRITLLSVVGKIFESIFAERISFLLLQSKELDDAQEGFWKGRGTSRMLYKLFANNNQIKCHQQKTNLIGTDLKKAFDSADISFMTINLIQCGVVGKLAGLDHDYLFNRNVQFQSDALISDSVNWNRGKAQGRIQPPLSSLIFIAHLIDQSICYQICT